MSGIVSLYMDKYGVRGEESEEKRVRALVRKLHEEHSVFCDFPFDYIAEHEQLTLLHYIMTALPERQIMANMKKVDVDRCYMNFVYQNQRSKIETKDMLENLLSDYSPISLASEHLQSRYIIRNPIEQTNDVLSYLLQSNESIIRNYFCEKEQFKLLGLEAHNFEYIREYIDYVANVLLQWLVYRVINVDSIDSLSVIKALSDEVAKMEGLVENQLARRKKVWVNDRKTGQAHLDAETVTSCFSMYITHRSKFYEEFNIKDVLKEEMLDSPFLFGDVPAEYEAKKVIASEDEIKSAKRIITENQNINDYNGKLKTARIFIDIMADYGGRQCYSSCVQDIKVYFREIFVSKSSYKRRMAHRIVNEYLEQVALAKKEGQAVPAFDKRSHYMFIREKINRGYFREKGLSKEYIGKIDFERKLYNLLLRLYLFYDNLDSIEFIYEVNYGLLKAYEAQLGQ